MTPTYDLVGFFDGASQGSALLCGVGAILKLENQCHYKIWMNCGFGTNTIGELLSLWILLRFCSFLGLDGLHVFGDLELIINWARPLSLIQILPLTPWLGRVRRLINSFLADGPSKVALVAAPGFIFYELWSSAEMLGKRVSLPAFA